jgi:hypothetical protein
MNSKDVGNISEAMILATLIRAGCTVLRPFGDNVRYDLAIDANGLLIRVQCKTGSRIQGVIQFPTSSSQNHRGRGRQGYKGQADYFGVYSPDTGECYFIPVEECSRSSCALRVQTVKSCQKKKIRFARDYDIAALKRSQSSWFKSTTRN